MTEQEWLYLLFEDVRAYFRYEAEPLKQKEKEAIMRARMNAFMLAREHAELDDDKAEQAQPVAWIDISEGQMSGLRYWSEPDNRHEVPLYTAPPKTSLKLSKKD